MKYTCSHLDSNPLPQGPLLKAPHCFKPLTGIGISYNVYALAEFRITFIHCPVSVPWFHVLNHDIHAGTKVKGPKAMLNT
jgi:hypothetical protein